LRNVLSRKNIPLDAECNTRVTGLIPAADVNQLSMPRLPSFFVDFSQRFLDTQDEVTMITAEQLVDGVDLDEGWRERNLGGTASQSAGNQASGGEALTY